MEILNNFGFEPVFFGAQIINFLILAFVFKKFLYKPVLGVLKNRQKTIEKGLKDAEEAGLALEKAESKKDQIISEASAEAEKIIEETKKSAEELKNTLVEQAKTESERIISEARDSARVEFEKAESAAQEMALKLSRSILNKVIAEIFTKEERQKIISRGIARIEDLKD